MHSPKYLWRSSSLFRILGVLVLGLSALVYLAAGFMIFSEFFIALEQDNGFSATGKTVLDKEMTAALVAFIAAPFVAWRTKTAFDEHITNRLNKAAEQLSSVERVPCREVDEDGKWVVWDEQKPNIEIRLGALYALERLATDSARDYFPIMEMICAYVRQNAPRVDEAAVTTIQQSSKVEIAPLRRPDIQKAITILGRRPYSSKAEARRRYELRLQGTALTNIDMEDLDLTLAWLGNANFRSSYLGGTILKGAWLNGADFSNAMLHDPFMNKSVNLELAALRLANFGDVQNLHPKILDKACGVKSGYGKTILPENINPPAHWFPAKHADKDSPELLDDFNEYWRKKLKDGGLWFDD